MSEDIEVRLVAEFEFPERFDSHSSDVTAEVLKQDLDSHLPNDFANSLKSVEVERRKTGGEDGE